MIRRTEHEQVSDRSARNGKVLRTGIMVAFCFFLSFVSFISASEGARTLDLGEGDTWHFFRGSAAPPAGWQRTGFDDSSWEQGPAGYGYGADDRIRTTLRDMRGTYTTIYVRREFIVDDSDRITRLSLSLVCDGPFIAYLNGIEALRSKRPQRGELLDLTGFAHELDQQVNVLAVQCSNEDVSSDDFLFLPAFHYQED